MTGASIEATLELWASSLREVKARMRPLFTQERVATSAGQFLDGLLGEERRKTGWMRAEAAGDPGPWRQQAILGRGSWDADSLRNIVRDYALETLAYPNAVLVLDETGFLKQGKASCGVGRQYTGSAGKITNCQIGVFASYVSRHGHAFIDRALYLPNAWTDETDRSKHRAETELQAALDDLDGCFEGQGGQDLVPRDRVAKLVQRDRLRTEKTAAERDREKARDGVVADLFTAELDRMPDATRGAELEQALKDAQDARDTARDAQREAIRLYREAFEAADRSDLATEQATLLEELRSGARKAAVARLGVLAARGALRRLAAERRSDMLRDVEEAFVAMTTPAWTGVDVWSQAEGDKLVGIQPDGSSVPVEQMSTGTMGQLYFALRLAGYRSFAREPGPLPMILDDIMETFDDRRARAALRLCAEIGTNGRAILFTHHPHLVELARDTIKGVSVVNMPDWQV
jgi:hypothetical protein